MKKEEGFLSQYKYGIYLLTSLIFIGLIWWYGGEYLWRYFGGSGGQNQSANLRGDSYGVLNTLFSGLAFAGIIISIIMQSEELKLQRDEMKDTREVFQRDIFEKGFYNLLDLIEKTINELEIQDTYGMKKNGIDSLIAILSEGFTYRKGNILLGGIGIIKLDEKSIQQLLQNNNNFSLTLSKYIRTLHVILTSIFKKIENKNDQSYYLAILRSRLSSIEMELIKIKNQSNKKELQIYYDSLLESYG